MEKFFQENNQFIQATLRMPSYASDIYDDGELYIEDYFNDVLETCYQMIESEIQLTLVSLNNLLNAKDTLLDVDFIRHAED